MNIICTAKSRTQAFPLNKRLFPRNKRPATKMDNTNKTLFLNKQHKQIQYPPQVD